MQSEKKIRLDRLLTERGLAASRSQARDLIRRGAVFVAGERAAKPGMGVSPASGVRVVAGAGGFVSRGALKLAAALDAFGFDADDRVALDVGASTGGFCQLLLVRGARRVYAVDVGRGQLHETLRAEPRLVSLEGIDARALDRRLVPEPVTAVSADVSFISLTKVLPPALALAAPGAWLVALIKPQFEVGPAAIGRGGIVKDAAIRRASADTVASFVAALPGWTVAGLLPSPIAGKSGNREYLLGARKDGEGG